MSDTKTVSPLRQRMIEDMAARKLNPHTQRGHISSCKRFAAWLKRSPDTATPDEVRRFQLHLIESGASICNRNRIMTGVRFLFRVTLRRHDLAAEVWHIKEPQKLPPVLSREEVKLPAGKALIPGVITHGSNFVEHPEAIAQRIGRFANVVGRENVIASADCGFASFSTTCEVHPTVVWAKLAALAEGARLATKELWGRA